MSRRVVYFNNRFIPEKDARVSIYDSGLTAGDMAFEVTRTYRHQPFRLRGHLERLFSSLAALWITLPLGMDELERLTLETLARNLPTEADDVDWNIIHNVSRGPAAGFRDAFSPEDRRPTLIISCYPLLAKMAALAPAYSTGLDLVVPPQRALPAELFESHIKTRSRLHYKLADLQAAEIRPGAFALLVDPDGFLTECTSGNVFLVRDGELLTPEPRNLLLGVTREMVLHLAGELGIPAREANLTAAESLSAQEMFVTSTSIGILHARTFEGHLIGDGSAGPITKRLRAAFESAVGVNFAQQAESYARRMSKLD
ncbi:MAG: aminotransferase class IV [Planctomycetes bacterium]|nr:aminotransferase class IV [Planctomycetota bacterium]